MIKKINIKNFTQSFNAKSKKDEIMYERHIPDKFECNIDNLKNEAKVNIEKFLSNVDFPELISSLIKKQHWSNSVDFVGFNTKKNLLHSVNTGLLDLKDTEVKISTFSLEEFNEMLTNITANNIIKKPENEAEYKRLYLDILNYIKNNRYTE